MPGWYSSVYVGSGHMSPLVSASLYNVTYNDVHNDVYNDVPAPSALRAADAAGTDPSSKRDEKYRPSKKSHFHILLTGCSMI